jgi:hypothetical protein
MPTEFLSNTLSGEDYVNTDANNTMPQKWSLETYVNFCELDPAGSEVDTMKASVFTHGDESSSFAK